LTQEPRTAAEQTLFEMAVAQSHIWYVHRLVQIWFFTMTPPGVLPRASRGWPDFETNLAILGAHWGCSVLDLDRCESGSLHADRGWPAPGAAVNALIEASQLNPDGAILAACETPKRPPLTPKAFSKSLAGKVFSRAGDMDLLVKLYDECFHIFAKSKEVLDFGGLDWGDLEVERVADALPSFTRLRELSLAGNDITEIGAGFLAEEIPVCRSLRKLFLTENDILPGLEGSERLREAWAQAGKDEYWLMTSYPPISENVRRCAGLDQVKTQAFRVVLPQGIPYEDANHVPQILAKDSEVSGVVEMGMLKVRMGNKDVLLPLEVDRANALAPIEACGS